jgi:sulfur relay (sulfurtransferase) DsrF/TusC family protein
MIGSRSILLGLAIVALAFTNRRETLGFVLIGDGLLQLFDALMAFALRKRTVAALPAVLCVLDGLAGITLLR